MPTLSEPLDPMHSTAGPKESAVTLSASDLLTLAKELLAESRPTLPPPAGIGDTITVLGGVIGSRRECTTWYQQHNLSDDSHLHFIEVLQSLESVLCQIRTGSQKVSRQNLPTVHRGPPCPENPFNALEVERLRDSILLDAPQAKQTTKTDASKITRLPAQQEIQLGGRHDDRDFALWCTLKECHQVRLYIKQVWSERHQTSKPVSLAVASQITHNALVLCLAGVDEFAEEFPELGTFEEITRHVDVQLSISKDGVESFSCKRGMSKDTEDTVSSYDLLCMPALILLCLIREVVDNCEAIDSPLDAVDHIMSRRCFDRDLFGSSLEIMALYRNEEIQSAWAGGDMFTRLFADFMQSHEDLPLRIVFALQMELDLYNSLGGRTGVEAAELLAQCGRLKISLSEFDKAALGRLDCPLLGGRIDASATQSRILDIIHCGVETPLYANRRFTFHSEDGPVVIPTLLYVSPRSAGHISGVLSELAHKDGIDTCNRNLLIHSLAHLYKACQKRSPDLNWPDMDWIIARQGGKAFGLLESDHSRTLLDLDTPATILQGPAMFFGLSLGVELTKYARQRRQGPHGTSARLPLPSYATCLARAERLKIHSVYVSTRDRCAETARNLNLPEHTMLKAACHQSARKKSLALGADRKRHAQKYTNDTFTTIQTLSLLKAGLGEEQFDMLFNFHMFFYGCLSAMDRVISFCRDDRRFRGLFRPNMMFHEIVDEILWQASKPGKGGRSILSAATEALSGFTELIGASQIQLVNT